MKIRKMHNDDAFLYMQMKNGRKTRYGRFHKGAFHIHTPVSYDFRLRYNLDQKTGYCGNMSIEAIYESCCEINPMFRSMYPTCESIDVPEGFLSLQEYIAYLCMAFTLIQQGLEYVVVSDHNVLGGAEKLEKALQSILNSSTTRLPTILYGVEISCADKNHVVVIYDNTSKEASEKISRWLDDYIMTPEDGSYCTSLDVLREFQGSHFISYIAHLNSRNTFKDMFSLAYKKQLFQVGYTSLIGLSDLDKEENIASLIDGIVPHRKYNFIYDNDAHSIEELCVKHTYIKCANMSFAALQGALNDYDTCVSFKAYEPVEKYIEGIIIKPGKRGFLCKSRENTDKPMLLDFSPAMNCIIGGRGTGKSTIINAIDIMLGGGSVSEGSQKAIYRHDEIQLLYRMGDREYIVRFNQPVDPSCEAREPYSILCDKVSQGNRDWRRRKVSASEVLEHLQSDYIDVVEVVAQDTALFERKLTRTEVERFFDTAFNKTYSINGIMTMIDNEEISHFIVGVIRKHPTIAPLLNTSGIYGGQTNSVLSFLQRTRKKIVERNKKLVDILQQYNVTTNSNLRIRLQMNTDYSRIVSLLVPEADLFPNRWVNQCNISSENFAAYISHAIFQMGLFEFLELMLANRYDSIIDTVDLVPYLEQRSQDLVNHEVHILEKREFSSFLRKVCSRWSEELIRRIIGIIVEQPLRFDLCFDIRSDAKHNEKEYRSLSELSLGQKVVAILTFIMDFGMFSGDNTPLIIDQPEDNLDSQYVYSNLVRALKDTKDRRQVIIATHNSTLVTNTKTEQVVIMYSDNQHGWIHATGYPGQPHIVKGILRFLEGGTKSFVHRISIYQKEIDKEYSEY